MTTIQKWIIILLLSIILTFGLTACFKETFSEAPETAPIQIIGPENPYQAIQRPENTPESSVVQWPDEDPRLDSQGAVEIEINPIDINQPREVLEFSISLNTHSVDLNMDLTQLVSLETDTGVKIPPSSWDGPTGGHHLKGIMIFPAEVDGTYVLEGATRMIITINDIDAPERVFVWQR